MVQDKGLELTDQECSALNRWLARLLLEEAGPGLPPPPGFAWHWNVEDMERVLKKVSTQLGEAYSNAAINVSTTSTNIWKYIGRHQPELIVVMIKAGAFKEIEAEPELANES